MNIVSRSVCASLLGSLVLSSSLAADDPAGHWIGGIDTPDGHVSLELELRNDEGAWGAAVIFPEEGRQRLVAETVELGSEGLSLDAAGGAMSLSGSFEGNQLEGMASIRGNEFPLRLVNRESEPGQLLIAEQQAAIRLMRSRPFELVSAGRGRDLLQNERIDALVEQASESLTSAMVIRVDGELVGEWLSDGQPRPIEAMSVTKAVMNLVFGRLHTLGRISSIDQPVHEFFDEWGEGARADITIRHLLTHTSGLDPAVPTTELYQSGNFVRFALEAPIRARPGTEISYNNNAANLLSAIAERAAGEPLDTFLARDLFGMLGVSEFCWSRDNAGYPHGMSGLRIHARDLAKLGQLALDLGRWENEQLIEADWFTQSFSPATGDAKPVGLLADRAPTVGLLWFLESGAEPEGARIIGANHSGYLGQYLVLDFVNRVVAVRMIEANPAYDPESDGFRDFPRTVLELINRPL